MIGPVIFPRNVSRATAFSGLGGGESNAKFHCPRCLKDRVLMSEYRLTKCVRDGDTRTVPGAILVGIRKPRPSTERVAAIWEELELTLDSLAGPLYSIYEQGECDYVFRERLRFPTIHDPDSFLKWCLSHPRYYRRRALKIGPTTNQEEADQAKLLEIAAGMERLSRMAYEIVKKRHPEPGNKVRRPKRGKGSTESK